MVSNNIVGMDAGINKSTINTHINYNRMYIKQLLLGSLLAMAACQQPAATEQSPAAGVSTGTTAADLGTPPPLPPGAPVQWKGFDAAVSANAQQPKLIFIDVYTDWCGWCKVMDNKTFSQPEVADFMNEHFHNVKMNAETEGPINFNGQAYTLVSNGNRMIHTLAASLLDGQLSYPSYVYLTPNFERITISKGFKPADQFMEELKAVVAQYQ